MSDISSLIGQELTSVEFIQDHLILHFDGPAVTFFAWPDVFREEGSYAYGEPEYRNVLCGVITEDVTAATLEDGEAIEIEFESGIILRALSPRRRCRSPDRRPILLWRRVLGVLIPGKGDCVGKKSLVTLPDFTIL